MEEDERIEETKKVNIRNFNIIYAPSFILHTTLNITSNTLPPQMLHIARLKIIILNITHTQDLDINFTYKQHIRIILMYNRYYCCLYILSGHSPRNICIVHPQIFSYVSSVTCD